MFMHICRLKCGFMHINHYKERMIYIYIRADDGGMNSRHLNSKINQTKFKTVSKSRTSLGRQR